MSKNLTPANEGLTPKKAPDVSIYRAINPRWNMSLQDARDLARILTLIGFPPAAIVCHPQGDEKGWGITGEITEKDVVDAGVPTSEPIHLAFVFQGHENRHNCAAVGETFEETSGGVMSGYMRLYAELNPGAPPQAWMDQLLRVPGVMAAINTVLAERIKSGAPPLTLRPA